MGHVRGQGADRQGAIVRSVTLRAGTASAGVAIIGTAGPGMGRVVEGLHAGDTADFADRMQPAQQK
jgi:hypothetical protein